MDRNLNVLHEWFLGKGADLKIRRLSLTLAIVGFLFHLSLWLAYTMEILDIGNASPALGLAGRHNQCVKTHNHSQSKRQTERRERDRESERARARRWGTEGTHTRVCTGLATLPLPSSAAAIVYLYLDRFPLERNTDSKTLESTIMISYECRH